MNGVHVAIVGGGPNGIIALYECKIRNIKATLYEKERNFGGVWNLNSSQIRGHKSTVFNTSTHLSSWNVDFTLFKYLNDKHPLEDIIFPNIFHFKSYLDEFVRHHQLVDMISFNKKVTGVATNPNQLGYTLKVFNNELEQEESFVHDYIIFATGHYGSQIIPKEPFLSQELQINTDKVWHTSHWDPLDPDSKCWALAEKPSLRILVVGSGPSAGEAIVDTINRTKSVGNYEKLEIIWAPTREPLKRSVWLIDFFPHRDRNSVLAADEIFCRLFSYLPNWVAKFGMKKILQCVSSHTENAFPDLLRDRICICNASLITKSIKDNVINVLTEPIERIYKSDSGDIVFDMSSKKSNQVDAVVIGSGYTFGQVQVDGKFLLENSRFYNNIIPVDDPCCSRIGFICMIGVIGSTFPVGQMTLKWIFHQWFDKNSRLEDTLAKLRKKDIKEFPPGIPYLRNPPGVVMDELARDMNVTPNIYSSLLSLFPRQRHLALAYLIGPWSIFHYPTLDESVQDRIKRENIVLSMTANVFRKSDRNFENFCKIIDFLYFFGVGTILYLLLSCFK